MVMMDYGIVVHYIFNIVQFAEQNWSKWIMIKIPDNLKLFLNTEVRVWINGREGGYNGFLLEDGTILSLIDHLSIVKPSKNVLQLGTNITSFKKWGNLSIVKQSKNVLQLLAKKHRWQKFSNSQLLNHRKMYCN